MSKDLKLLQRVKGINILWMASHVGSYLMSKCFRNLLCACHSLVLGETAGFRNPRLKPRTDEAGHHPEWVCHRSPMTSVTRVWSSPSAPYLTLTVTSVCSVSMSSPWELQCHRHNVPFPLVYLCMTIIA